MKRYWLFAGDNYYPNGGMDDFVGSFYRIDEAKKIGSKKYAISYDCKMRGHSLVSIDWVHILDSEKNKIILRGNELLEKEAFGREKRWGWITEDEYISRFPWARNKNKMPTLTHQNVEKDNNGE